MDKAELLAIIEKAAAERWTELDLRDEDITELPAEIRNLINITWIDLGCNQIMQLPAEIGNLTKLTWLDLHGNQLMQIPEEMANLINLKRLRLRGNNFDIPEEIYDLDPAEQLLYLCPPIAEPPDWRPPCVMPEDYYAN